MIVQTLGIKHLGQFSLVSSGFFQLCSLVLEPDLDLILVEAKFPTEVFPALLSQVSVGLELVSQLLQLLRAEGCPRPLVVIEAARGGHWSRSSASWLLLLDLPDPGS